MRSEPSWRDVWPATKNDPLTDVPGASVSVAEIRCFSNLNSDTIWYRIDGLQGVGSLAGRARQARKAGGPFQPLPPFQPTASERDADRELGLLARLRSCQLAQGIPQR